MNGHGCHTQVAGGCNDFEQLMWNLGSSLPLFLAALVLVLIIAHAAWGSGDE